MSDLVKVLIIGNDKANLAEILPMYGYDVFVAKFKENALKIFGSKIFFDIIFIEFEDINNSFEILKGIRNSKIYSDVPIVIIGESESKAVFALKLGADEYFKHPLNIPLFLARIEALTRRAKHLWSEDKFKNVTNNKNNYFNSLTEREKDVLLLVVQGSNNKEIADKLVISEVTVKGHISKILKKLNVTSRTQAILLALKMNIEERNILRR
jgi:DNA-binding NarL/FixJ family response regulator